MLMICGILLHFNYFLQVDVVVFVLSPVSDDLEALGRSSNNTPITIPASGLARFVMTGQDSRSLKCPYYLSNSVRRQVV